jgi:hypothetical protein
VIITELGEEEYTFNAYYEQEDNKVHIMGEGFEFKGLYDGDKIYAKRK